MHSPESVVWLEELIEYHMRQEDLCRKLANVHLSNADEHGRQATVLENTLRRMQSENESEM